MGASQSVSTMGQLQLPVIVLALECALVVRSDQVILKLNELSVRQEPRGHSRLRDHVRVPVWGWHRRYRTGNRLLVGRLRAYTEL